MGANLSTVSMCPCPFRLAAPLPALAALGRPCQAPTECSAWVLGRAAYPAVAVKVAATAQGGARLGGRQLTLQLPVVPF
jgi:hypothetical protein